MNRIAVLLTTHNRKDKTLACLNSLFKAIETSKTVTEIYVYLTDDGSTDGTSEAVQDKFPEVKILNGNGSLYWAGGMRNSWNAALSDKKFDAFLLLNDDITLLGTCFDELTSANEFSLNQYGVQGIYIGSIKDPDSNKCIYGGRAITNGFTFKTQIQIPTGTIKKCQLGNANIMLVCKNVVDKIGILSLKYIHGKADFDYTLRAVEKNIPVLVCGNYCGYGSFDHHKVDLTKMSLKQRLNYLYSPKGIEYSSYMYFMSRFFAYRVPLVWISLWLSVLFPKFSVFKDVLLNRYTAILF